MKAIKLLLVTVVAACTFAAANAQLRLPPPPPRPPAPPALHLGGRPAPPRVYVSGRRKAVVVRHNRRRAIRRPARRY